MRPNIFITSFFRSKHYHLSESLKRHLGYSRATTVGLNHHGDDEQVVNLHASQILFGMDGLIFDQHTRASGNTSTYLAVHDQKVVVMLRDLPSCLSDLKENFDSGNTAPGIQKPVYWKRLDEHKKWRWIAYNATPWFLSFYVGWMQSNLDKKIVWSEDYEKVPGAVLSSILGHLELDDWMKSPETTIPWQHNEGPVLGLGNPMPVHCINIIYDQMESWGTRWEKDMREKLFIGG